MKLLKKMIEIAIVLSLMTLVGCSNETNNEQEQVEEEMTQILEDGKEIVVEPLGEDEIDIAKIKEMEAELKESVADITGLEDEAIALILSIDREPSCSIVLGTELTIGNTIVEEIKQSIIQTVSKENVAMSEEDIILTNKNGKVF